MKFNFTKKESIKKLIFIFNKIEKKFIKSSIILLFSMIGAGICELLVLMSLSNFLGVILKDGQSFDVITSNNLETSNNFYSQIVNLGNNFTGSDLVSNCILFIFIALFTFFVKLFTLNVGLKLTAKIASSLDGKSHLLDDQKTWVTCKESREDVQKLRASVDVILTGGNTVVNDNPLMNARVNFPINQPKKILLSSKTNFNFDAPFFKNANYEIITNDNPENLLVKLNLDMT